MSAKSRSALLTALCSLGVLSFLYWFTREREPEATASQARESSAPPVETELAGAPVEQRPDLTPAVSERDSVVAMTRIRVYGLPNRVLLPDATCGIRTSRKDIRSLAMQSNEFECPASDLEGALLEVGASDYVTIGHRLGRDVPSTLDLELQLSGTIDVTVVTGNENPVEGAWISVYPQDTSKPDKLRIRVPEIWKDPLLHGPPSLTNSDGNVRLRGVPCDTPLVVGASRAVADVVAKVVVPSSERIARVVLHAPVSGCIRGRLVWPDGSAVTKPFAERFKVCATESQQVSTPKVHTNEQGEFELCGLPRGRATWYVERIGEHIRMTDVDADVVDVGPVVIRDLVPLNGRVLLESAPAEFDYRGVRLCFFKDGACVGRVPNLKGGGLPSGVNRLERDGTFSTEVPAGALTVEVEGGGWPLGALDIEVPTPDLEIRLDPFVAGVRLTNVPARATDTFSITFHESSAMRAQPDATRLTWASTAYANGGDRLSQIVWDSEDELRLLLLRPGSYDVFMTRDSTPALFAGSVILVAGSIKTLECHPQGSGRVTGRVVDHDGSPVSGASVGASLTIESHASKKAQRIETAEDGTFAFEGLVSGPWIIYPASLGVLSSSAVRLNIEPGHTRDVQLTVAKPGSISGRITFDGAPAPDVKFYLSSARPSSDSFRQTKTNERGEYQFERLCPGEYELSMLAPDYGLRRWMIVESGRDSIFDCELNPPVTPVVFVRNGEVLDSLDSAFQYTRLGGMGMAPWTGRPGVWIGVLDGGPVFALLASKATSVLLDPEPPEQFVLAYASDCPPVEEQSEIHVRGAMLRVRASDRRAVLPFAHVEGVGELRGSWEPSDGPTLVYDDVDGERRFADVPVGTTLLLVSPRTHSDKTWTQRVVVTNEADMTIVWPPAQ